MGYRGFALALSSVCLTGLVSIAYAAPACEPAKLAQKYPSLVGRTIKIGVDPQTPPYAMRDGADFNKIIGSDVDLAAAVLDCAGVKHEVFLGGWSGLMPATAAGQVDVFMDNLYYLPERAKQLDFILYMQAASGVLTQAGNPKKITSMDSSCGTTYAVGLGTVQKVAAEKQGEICKSSGRPDIAIMTFADLASGIRLVQSGRADALMTDIAMVDALAADNPNLYARGFEYVMDSKMGAGLKKGDTDLLNAVYDGLQALQANGTEKAIFEKYKVDPNLQIPATIKTE